MATKRKRARPAGPEAYRALVKDIRENAVTLVRSIEMAQEAVGSGEIELSSLLVSFSHGVEVVSDSFLVRATEIIDEADKE
jgi:hypothetical protein